ncbi:hypothetical protein Acr_22g0008490 [Actinidia rufa]|uniref:Bet v I/Major latex protein domain-containing protein n=1 Tax=Actinidia rufa TaxID=165716 RepID=A0A7J0GL30_9ERIC|nr:hypothetical protein Acr_22g0008490 [Actinidia rufa]
MGVINFDIEIPSPIPPAKMFKAGVLDADNLAHKMMPDAIKSVETLEGDGALEPSNLPLLAKVRSQHKFVKQRVDAIDKENFTYSYTIIEGDVLTNTFESISYHIKIVASPDGGSICKTRSIYTTKGDAHISEDEIKAGKEKASQIIKAIEAYLLANPDYC